MAVPREYWGTSSAQYGEVDQFGRVIKTPQQLKEEAEQYNYHASSVPREYWGTSSAQYGEVDLNGNVVKTPQQLATEAGQQPLPYREEPKEPISLFEEPTFVSKDGTTTITRQGGTSLSKPIMPSPLAMRDERIERAKAVYEKATPAEKLGLRASTLLSSHGFEFISSGFTQYFGGTKPEEVTIGYISELGALKPRYETRYFPESSSTGMGFEPKPRKVLVSPEEQAATSAAFQNPVTEFGSLYLGGLALGTVSRAPAVVSYLSKGTRAVTLGDIGKVATGVYLGSEGITAAGYVSQGDITKAGGTILRTAGTLGALGMGFKEGEKAGELLGIQRKATELAKTGKITPQTEMEIKQATSDIFGRKIPKKSAFATRPEEVTLTVPKETGGFRKATFAEKLKVTETVKETGGTLYGSFPQEAQIKPELRRVVKDIDIGIPKGTSKAELSKNAGNIKLDIKPKTRLKEFIFYENPIELPGGTKAEPLRVQLARKITGATTPSRTIRKGGIEEYDVSRILKSQAEADILQGKKISPTRRAILERPLRERPIEAARFEPSDYSYLPQRTKITPSYLPKVERMRGSYLPSSERPSLLPSIPSSKLSGLPGNYPTIGKIPSMLPSRPSNRPPSRPSGLPSTYPSLTRSRPSLIGRYPIAERPQKAASKSIIKFDRTKTFKSIEINKSNISLKAGYAPSLIGAISSRTIKKAPKGILTGVEVRYKVKR